MFWDHDAKWCIKVVGAAEIDFRFSMLYPRTGFRHFREGISKLKQVTGRDHHDMQRYMVPIIADAVPKRFLIAICSLTDFCYLAQAPQIDDDICLLLKQSLAEFHANKDSVLATGARRGKSGNWYIPKLEFLQSVVPSICSNGVPMQWSADITEHAHITEIKDPARASKINNMRHRFVVTLTRWKSVVDLICLHPFIRPGSTFEALTMELTEMTLMIWQMNMSLLQQQLLF